MLPVYTTKVDYAHEIRYNTNLGLSLKKIISGGFIVRIFLGIEFPEEIIDELMLVQSQMRSETRYGRFVSRENLHLTLQFLGEVATEAIEPIVQVLYKTAKTHSDFSLVLKEIGSFGNNSPYRVVWAGIDGDMGALRCLQKDISDSLSVLGFSPENREYQPHATLGRDLDFAKAVSFEKYSAAFTKMPFGVDQFSLIESKLENGRRKYHALHTFRLGQD